MKRLRWAGYVALGLLVASGFAYWWLILESHGSRPGRYAVDVAEVRRLAGSAVGAMPQQIRVETAARIPAPEALIVAGDGWRNLDMPVPAFERVYPDHTVMIDTTFDSGGAKSMGATTFDAEGFGRIEDALSKASTILGTHEHPDHVGGLLAHRDVKRLIQKARFTPEQLNGLKKAIRSPPLSALHLPSDLFSGYGSSDYGRYQAIGAGVVLIKAPGHTPGSQMIYVRRADGVEYLFLGDAAWRMRNVETIRERARLVTWLGDEDRQEVLDELAELHRIHEAEPNLHMIPSHDAAAIGSLVGAHLLTEGF